MGIRSTITAATIVSAMLNACERPRQTQTIEQPLAPVSKNFKLNASQAILALIPPEQRKEILIEREAIAKFGVRPDDLDRSISGNNTFPTLNFDASGNALCHRPHEPTPISCQDLSKEYKAGFRTCS